MSVDRVTVWQALDGIARRAKGHVYASRKGLVAGWQHSDVPGLVLCFRREGGAVWCERWETHSRSGTVKLTDRSVLPPDLEKIASDMLDNL